MAQAWLVAGVMAGHRDLGNRARVLAGEVTRLPGWHPYIITGIMR